MSPRTKLRLSEIERLIRKHRIVIPPISQRRLREMCEEGVFATAPRRDGKHWLVYEDSFLDWVKKMDGE